MNSRFDPRSILLFLTGIALGFALHFAITLQSRLGGTTTVAEVSPPQPVGKAPATSRLSAGPGPRGRDAAAGNLLRKSLAADPVVDTGNYEEIERERDEAIAELTRLSEELLLSYGTMDEAGTTVGGVLRRLMDMESGAALDSGEEAHRELLEEMVSLVAMSEAVRELDDQPGEASRFQAAVIQEIGELSDVSAARVREILNRAYADAREAGINFASKPDENVDEWTERRAPFYEQVYAQIQDSVAPQQRALFAQFNAVNGFVDWKLVDPFDPGIFIAEPVPAQGAPPGPESLEYLQLPSEQSPIETTLLPAE